MKSRSLSSQERMLGGKAAQVGHRRRVAAGQTSPSQPGDVKKNRRARRRQKTEKKEPAKRYETLFEFDYYDHERDVESGVHYIGWYDQSARQKRRRSLQTIDAKVAFDKVSRVDESGM